MDRRQDAYAAGFTDTERVCCDCGAVFTFTAGEAMFYESKSLRPPRRCVRCRTAKRPHEVAGRRRWEPSTDEPRSRRP